MIHLSKSRFVSGAQCGKKLYFDLFRKDLKPIATEQQQKLFDSGHEVGALAQLVFPGGMVASPEHYPDFSKSLADTREWIQTGENTIYEAAFQHEGVLAALDILHHENGERWAIEVKSSGSVKEYHLTDAALQYWVMAHAGFKPDKVFLMHINKSYVRQGNIDPKYLFSLADITNKVLELQAWVTRKVGEFRLLQEGHEPIAEIGKQCHDPFSCDYIQHCWQHLPPHSVFELNHARGKDWTLYHQGITRLADIPDEIPLSHRQRIQVDGIKHGSVFVDKYAIGDFLSKWSYPLYFFDFETVFPAIPIMNGTSPFQQIPFQYSLHIVPDRDAKIDHREFLADPLQFSATGSIKALLGIVLTEESSPNDPRKSLINQLRLDIKPGGSIIVYNATFEIGVLKDLAKAFPEDKDFIDDLLSRVTDLLIPFRKAWYYLPQMGGSASIKSVLPAIAPAFSYAGLEISNGGDASDMFFSMIKGVFDGDMAQTRENLLKYCERDSEGMVVLWKELLNCLKGPHPPE
jgi:hypothetical protein